MQKESLHFPKILCGFSVLAKPFARIKRNSDKDFYGNPKSFVKTWGDWTNTLRTILVPVYDKKRFKIKFREIYKKLLYGSVNFKTLSKSLLKTLLLESFSMQSHKRTSSDPHVIINTICSNFTHVIINKLCRHVSVLTRILFK